LQKKGIMATTVSNINNQSLAVSSAEALWALIQLQTKDTRRYLIERLMLNDSETAEQILLSNSIRRGWNQVKQMRQEGKNHGTLQDLINELQ